MESFIRLLFQNWPTKLKQIILFSWALFGFKESPVIYKVVMLSGVILLDVIWDQTQRSFYCQKQLNKFCENIYDFLKEEEFRDVRVSILIVRRFLGFAFKILEVQGRFEQGEGAEWSKVFFTKGQGIAGICFSVNQVYRENCLPDPILEKEKYLEVCREKYKLGWQLKGLNRPARAYICFPIESPDKKGKVIAVLSLDSVKPNIFEEKKFRKYKTRLEKEIATFKLCFISNK